MTDQINARQVVRILELHRRGGTAGQIAHLVFGTDNRLTAVQRVLEAYGQNSSRHQCQRNTPERGTPDEKPCLF
jgi:hypothetical protein